tara:strand:+ start:9135 stop:9620 length:486 start_codon:yes stop_codon:yes gene_type:complete
MELTYIKKIAVVFLAMLTISILEPLFGKIPDYILPFLTPPSEQGILSMPYPVIVDVIASFTFIEPMIASFFICYIIASMKAGSLLSLFLKTTTALLVLTKSGPQLLLYMGISTMEPYIVRFLSMAQFTFEWLFIGVVLSITVKYLSKKQFCTKTQFVDRLE